MGLAPRFKRMSREDFAGSPAWFDPLFDVLNNVLGDTSNALTKNVTRSENLSATDKVGLTFKTRATIAETWPVVFKNSLATQPLHVVVSRFDRVDGAALTAAYSMTWKMNQSNEVELTFQGLDPSTDYRASVVYE